MKRICVVFNLGLLISALFFVSCSSSRKAYRTGDLLIKNNVQIIDTLAKTDLTPGYFSSFITPTPNSLFLGVVRLKLFSYELGTLQKENSKLRNWLQNSGEPPVYADSSKYDKTILQFKQELFNLGYFNPDISYTEKRKRNSNRKVTYSITPNNPYRYNNINNSIKDTEIKRIAYENGSNSLIKKDDILDFYVLDQERARISDILRDEGYFLFSKDLITYDVDTNLMTHKADLTTVLNDPIVQIDNVNSQVKLRKYYIRNVNIYSNYDPNVNYSRTMEYDISISNRLPEDGDETKGMYIVYDIGKQKLKPDNIINSILIKPGKVYSNKDVILSNRSLTNIAAIRYANISFTPVSSFNDSLLDCSIKLTRKKLHSPSISTEVTNTGGRLGFGLNLNYNNRNIFKGGESLQLTTSGSIELQFGKNNVDNGSLIYTAQAGITASLYFPKILAPFGLIRIPGYFSPKTNIDIGYNYQHRTELYERIISNVALGYSWKQGRYNSHHFTPIDFNYVHINKEDVFEEYISQMTGTLYQSQYTSHTLLGMRYSFVYSNLIDKVSKGNFFYFRTNVESSGNLLNLCSHTFKSEKDTLGVYDFLGVPYSQFVLADLEYKFYHFFSKNRVLVFRLQTGVGMPYSNSTALPIEKAFYGGGANDMRGWGLKLLGPGSYSEEMNIERVGDISLKANLEYRFAVYKFIRLALFADAGNIWLWNEDPDFVGGDFSFDRFYKEIAVDVGIGLRLDFDFFVLRLDVGTPIIDPSKSVDNRVVPFSINNSIWNIAIGYPF